jgi:hypothetical protein
MEDPVAFDLWVAISPGKKTEAQQLLQRAKPEMPRLALLQVVNKGTVGRELVPVVEELGWEEVQAWRAEAAAVGTVEVYQAGYGPSDDQRLHQCPDHGLRYGGCFGCPVCDGRARR